MLKQEIIKIENTGFIYEEAKEEDYIVGQGKVPKKIIFPSGHGWGNHRPIGEKQYNVHGVDGWTCVLHSGATCIEYDMNYKLQTGLIEEGTPEFKFNRDLGLLYKIEGKWQFNANDIILAIMSGARGKGTSLTNGAETIRKKGLVGENVYEKWQYAVSVEGMLAKANLTQDHIDRGKKWLSMYEVKHEWIFASKSFPSIAVKRDLIREHLAYGVIQFAGHAWDTLDANGYYGLTYAAANHAYVGEDFEEVASKLKRTFAFDTYVKNNSFIKSLAPEYLFSQAKQFTIISKFSRPTPVITKEDNMVFYKRKDNPDIYQYGEDKRYHAFFNEPLFKSLYGEFASHEIKEVEFGDSQLGETIYYKSSFINIILSFFSKLGKVFGKKEKI